MKLRPSRIAWALVAALVAATALSWASPLRTHAQEDLTELEETAMRAAVERVAPSVMRIETLGGLEAADGMLVGSGPSTGVAVSEDGYILSSAFHFVQRPPSILVTLPQGNRVAARIVARDHGRQLVLLKVETDQKLTVPEIVPRSELKVGQWTMAVGHTYANNVPSRSVGILSATSRMWGRAVQTDANVSPANYGGPLIDVRGRVIGILVPMAPDGQSELAGAEWYDSGIGFAIPLADLMNRLDAMKQGTDLHPGLLGVSLKGTDIYALPATIAACPAKSPARKAGLQVGDTIVEINGVAIRRQSQLRHALGPLLAGDTVRVVATRGDQQTRVEATVQLVAELEPYVRPELGILPMRGATPAQSGDSAGAGAVIRHVFPNSPAATSGLTQGDRIAAVDDTTIESAEALRDVIAGREPGERVNVRFVRNGQTQVAATTLGRSSTSLPGKLPPAHPPAASDAPATHRVGDVDVTIVESASKCVAFVPHRYNPAVPHGLVIWLHEPGSTDPPPVPDAWKPLCEERGLIVLAPRAADPRRWSPTEVELIRKAIDTLAAEYAVDPTRVVVHGRMGGGGMAYLVAFSNRDVVRGIAVVDSPLPAGLRAPATDPTQPLAVFSASSEKSVGLERIRGGEKRLEQLAFPVVAKTLPGNPRQPDEREMAELVDWIDTLDRI